MTSSCRRERLQYNRHCIDGVLVHVYIIIRKGLYLNYTRLGGGPQLQYTCNTKYNSNTPRSQSVARDTETGPKLLKDGSRQSLSHYISKLLRSRHVKNPNTAKGNMLVQEVNI